MNILWFIILILAIIYIGFHFFRRFIVLQMNQFDQDTTRWRNDVINTIKSQRLAILHIETVHNGSIRKPFEVSYKFGFDCNYPEGS